MTGTGISTTDGVARYGVATADIGIGIGVWDGLFNTTMNSSNAGFDDCTLEGGRQENRVGGRTDLARGGVGNWTRILEARLPYPLLIPSLS